MKMLARMATVEYIPRRPAVMTRPLSERKLLVLFSSIAGLILAQGIFFANQKQYVRFLRRDLSLLDGVLPTALVVGFAFLCFNFRSVVGFFGSIIPFWPFLIYLAFSLAIVGLVGKGSVTLVQSSIQFVFLYLGYVYANQNAKNPDTVIHTASKLFYLLPAGVVVSDVLYGAMYGFIGQEGPGTGRHNSSYGTYVLLGYFSSVCFVFWATVLMWGRLKGKKITYWGICLLSLLMLMVSGARTPTGAAVAALCASSAILRRGRRVIGIFLVSLILSLLTAWSGVEMRFVSVQGPGRLALNMEPTGRDSWYYDVWDEALRHPVFGAGWGAADEFVLDTRGSIYSTHSQHLQLFHDLGLMGYCLFLLGWVLIFLRFWRASQGFEPGAPEKMLLCFGMAFLVHLIMSMVTDSVWVGSLYYGNYGFFFVGTALVYSKRVRRFLGPQAAPAAVDFPGALASRKLQRVRA
jgi:hypothetical protein